jgi:hypothetical protein
MLVSQAKCADLSKHCRRKKKWLSSKAISVHWRTSSLLSNANRCHQAANPNTNGTNLPVLIHRRFVPFFVYKAMPWWASSISQRFRFSGTNPMTRRHFAFGGCLIVTLQIFALRAEAQPIPGTRCEDVAGTLRCAGIDFPDGARSFADAVIQYNPLFQGGPGPTDPNFMDPIVATGLPDYAEVGPSMGSVSLGRGGLIELDFLDNRLTNSGDALDDLHVFEIGPDVEDTFVSVRPTAATASVLGPGFDADGDGFYEVGKVFGSTSSIDIDMFFPGFAAGVLEFNAVQLVDDPNEGASGGATVGADIDAVGAITSVIPEPSSFVYVVLCLGLLFLQRAEQRPKAEDRKQAIF